MKQSGQTQLAQLYGALSKAQSGFLAIRKDSNGQSDGRAFKYASLARLIEASRPALAQNGLAVIQSINTNNEGKHVVSTFLVHEGGHSISTEIVIANASFDRIQDYGKVVTYMRRYSYSAILCLAADDDADADDSPLGPPPDSPFESSDLPDLKEPGKPVDPRPIYPQDEFKKRLQSRADSVKAGTKTPKELIDMIESRNRLTDEQRAIIECLEGPQA